MGIKIDCILCGEEMTKSHSLYGNTAYCDASCTCGLRFEANYDMDELDSWQDAMEIVEHKVDRALHQPQPDKDEWDALLDRVNEIVNEAVDEIEVTYGNPQEKTIYFWRSDNPIVYPDQKHVNMPNFDEVEVGDIIWDGTLGKSFTVTRIEGYTCLAEDLFKDIYKLSILNNDLVADKQKRKTPLYL